MVPHENTGSAGGFARGMQAALTDTHFCPTHILLMEDDVQVWPEAFVRTYALLSLLRHDYEKHFICGAMFCAGRRNIQQETLGFVQDNGANGSYGAGYDMNTAAAVLQNEQDAPLPCHAYAGWRYCCIPLPQTDHERLPLPLFMKWTDTAYSLSHKAEFLTLNGICFWHKDRSARFNACRELYLWYRNPAHRYPFLAGIIPPVVYQRRTSARCYRRFLPPTVFCVISTRGCASAGSHCKKGNHVAD